MSKRSTMTASEAAEVLGISTPTLYKWASEKMVPCIDIDGRRLFPRKAIQYMADYGVLPASCGQVETDELAEAVAGKVMHALFLAIGTQIKDLAEDQRADRRHSRMGSAGRRSA